MRFDLESHAADPLLHSCDGVTGRHAKAVGVLHLEPVAHQTLLDLGPSTVNEDEPHPQAVQQSDVVDEAPEALRFDGLAAKLHDERLAAVSVDVGRRVAEPVDELSICHGRRV